MTSVLGQMVLTFGILSLISVGGANATVPEIHRQVVDVLHWMDDATFANLIAIGQTAPGPNVLIVSMIGWHVAGVLGLLLATVAIVLPSSILAIAVGRVINRSAADGWIIATRAGLAPIAVGFMIASGYVMTRAAYINPLTIAIVGIVAAMIYVTRRSPIAGIAGGAMIGFVAHRFHDFG